MIRPHAMIAAMLGMIMFDRNVPNFCTWTRAPGRAAGVLSVVAMLTFLQIGLGVTPIT